jgi:hypothetical protein
MLGATAMMSSGVTINDYGVSISQRLRKANDEFEPPKQKQYNQIKNVNDRLWGYFEEFKDYVHAGDSVNLRSICKECPNFTTYFDAYDHRLYAMMRQFNALIEHARLGEHREIVAIFEDIPEFTHIVHTFVGNIDIKKQCYAIHYLAKKKDTNKLQQYIRNHSEILSTVSNRHMEISAFSNRNERVKEYNELLLKIKEGQNANIRILRRTDPNIASDIADIIECDRLVNFDTMLACAAEGNAGYMKYLVDLYPYLVNYISEQVCNDIYIL